MNYLLSLSSAKPSLSGIRALCLATGLTLAATTGFAQVPATMQKDFKTSVGGIAMVWSPSGYWVSERGAARGTKEQVKELIGTLNQTERANRKIPAGYVFAVGSQGEIVARSSSGAAPALAPAPASNDAPGALPAPTPYAAPAPARQFSELRPVTSPTSAPVPQPYVARPAVKGKPVPIPPLPVESPRIVEATPRPVPKALPFEPKTKPVAEVLPPVKPVVSSGPKLIAEAPPATPVALPAPRTVAAEVPSAAGAGVDGIPAGMQKSFLSRNKSVFMIFDKDKGTWTSSPGAIKDVASADAWCKQATSVDQVYGRIPAGFSYHHLGNGQVQIRKD